LNLKGVLHEPSPSARSRYREKPDQGEILAVGNGKVQENGNVRPLEVKVGDRVLFGKYSGQTVKVKGEELLVMREEDIMAVLVD
jgi:chaperonin GroES